MKRDSVSVERDVRVLRSAPQPFFGAHVSRGCVTGTDQRGPVRGGGGGGPVIPYPFNSEHSYPLSLKVSTALSPKVSRVEFSIIP